LPSLLFTDQNHSTTTKIFKIPDVISFLPIILVIPNLRCSDLTTAPPPWPRRCTAALQSSTPRGRRAATPEGVPTHASISPPHRRSRIHPCLASKRRVAPVRRAHRNPIIFKVVNWRVLNFYFLNHGLIYSLFCNYLSKVSIYMICMFLNIFIQSFQVVSLEF